MSASASMLRDHALAIWQAALAAVKPQDLLHRFFAGAGRAVIDDLDRANRIIVVGAGKAGAAMSEALETCLARYLPKMAGFVNVPVGSVRPLQSIVLHAARPVSSNQPTAEGVFGTERILDLVRSAGSDDVVLCLLSGGGSALLPAPVPSLSLADKQRITFLLHECGATIQEMNAVRKHLSRSKGGRLASGFHGLGLHSLIISDVIGDPLDVIASGPTAPDPSTFADALAILKKYDLLRGKSRAPKSVAPDSVREYLQRGANGQEPETPKALPPNIQNHVIGNNKLALSAAEQHADKLGYKVQNLGSCLEGETRLLAGTIAGIARGIRNHGMPLAPPACILCGGETTVTLSPDHGLGGRNQEFVLAVLDALGNDGMQDAVVLSGGTDGEDGPTDAAGAIADLSTLEKAAGQGLLFDDFLRRHDSYHFFEATGDLLKTGLTQTNVTDIRLMLLA